MKSIYLYVWRKIVLSYNWIKQNQIGITVYVIIVAAYGFADRLFKSNFIVDFDKLLDTPMIFLWTIVVCSVFFLAFGLIPIKPFKTKADYYILMLPLGLIGYFITAYYFGWSTKYSSKTILYTLIAVVLFLFVRYIVSNFNSKYVKYSRELFYNNYLQNVKGLFKPDRAIKTASQDKLGRADYAASLAEAIMAYNEEESLVVGLTGEWGSGKSSIINMMLEYIKAKVVSGEHAHPIIVEFNPWNFSDQNQLIDQFFKTLSSTLVTQSTALTSKYLGDKLNAYADIFKVVTSSEPAFNILGLAKNIINAVSEPNKNESLLEAKKEIDAVLRNNPGKILVVIDDLDRLTAREIRQIFQLIKTIADFVNTTYLLSFDKNIVIENLSAEQQFIKNGDGSKYLEKIVQVSFDIPQGHKGRIENLLFPSLDEMLIGIPKGLFDQGHWANIYIDGIKKYIQNLRDVTRYLNTLRFQYNLVKKSVNVADFFAIVALQVFDYKIYCLIRDNKKLLVGGWRELSTDDAKEKEQLTQLCKIIEDSSRVNIIPLIRRLFPKTELIYSNTHYGGSFQGEWRKEGRVCHPDLFDIYFTLSLENNDFSKSDMENIIRSFSDEQLLRLTIAQLIEENRIIRFLELLEDYTGNENDIPNGVINTVITVILDFGDKFPDVRTGNFFELTTPLRIARVIIQLMRRFANQADRDAIALNALGKVEDSLYSLIYVIHLFDQQHGRYGLKDNPEPEEARIVSGDCLNSLEELGLKRITQWADNGKLLNLEKFKVILLIWQNWESNEAVQSYIKARIGDDGFFTTFMEKFIDISKSQTFTDYLPVEHEMFDIETIKRIFGDMDTVLARTKQILNNSSLEVSEKSKKAMALFLKKIENPQTDDDE